MGGGDQKLSVLLGIGLSRARYSRDAQRQVESRAAGGRTFDSTSTRLDQRSTARPAQDRVSIKPAWGEFLIWMPHDLAVLTSRDSRPLGNTLSSRTRLRCHHTSSHRELSRPTGPRGARAIYRTLSTAPTPRAFQAPALALASIERKTPGPLGGRPGRRRVDIFGGLGLVRANWCCPTVTRSALAAAGRRRGGGSLFSSHCERWPVSIVCDEGRVRTCSARSCIINVLPMSAVRMTCRSARGNTALACYFLPRLDERRR